MLTPHLLEFQPDSAEHLDWIAAIWNSASGNTLPISTGFVEFNTRPSTGGIQTGAVALDADARPLGFVLSSAQPGAPEPMDPRTGWIDAIAVAPPFQRQGLGRQLLQHACTWLSAQGCHKVLVGGSLRPFTPGVPTELNSEHFFTRAGFSPAWADGIVWDVARDLSDYEALPGLDRLACAVRPAQPGDKAALLEFLAREFPGRWFYECQEFLHQGGRISDYMVLWTEEGVQGACRLTFEDSAWPIERFYPYQLPRPWGQLGSIGIAAAVRGRQFGLALLDGGLRRLHNNGVNGCVIDWTTLLDFYAKAGFQPYRSYRQMALQLERGG